jgi:thymidylate kinase
MKIAITGTHRVGKTTLAEALQERLAGYELRMEPYYELEEAGYLFTETPDVEDFIDQFRQSVKQLSTGDSNVIFDRCPVDLLAYIHAIDEKRNIQSLFNEAERIMAEIDLLIFVPIENADEQPLRTRVNELLQEWVWDFGVETIEVTGTLQERVEKVLGKITLLT